MKRRLAIFFAVLCAACLALAPIIIVAQQESILRVGRLIAGTLIVTESTTQAGDMTVTGTFTANADAILGASTTDELQLNGCISGETPLCLDGPTLGDGLHTFIQVEDPTAIRTVALANADGTFATNATSPLNIGGNGVITIDLTHEMIFNSGGRVGATAGWVTTLSDRASYTLPAGQTNATLVIPVDGFWEGDEIVAFSVRGQIESSGNTVTLDADLRKLQAQTGDLSDVSVATISTVSVTADTVITATATGFSEPVMAEDSFYVLITATTGLMTDIDLQGVTLTVNQS
jgi:hypothetical protein